MDIIEYYGYVQGTVHGLFIGAEEPYFTIRDLVTLNIIKCYYKQDMYDKVYELFSQPDNVVFVSGLIRADRQDRKIESITIESGSKMKVAEQYKKGDLLKFFGCVPDLLNGTSLEQLMDELRNDTCELRSGS